jgi:hypothetical protein
VDKNDNLIAIDFGCMKEIPNDFYVPYFEVSTPESLKDMDYFTKKLFELEILKTTDKPKELEFFTDLFHELLSVFTRPINQVEFDFADMKFQNDIAALSEKFASDKTLRKMNGNRGSKHFIYVNRTFFGLYSLMFDIKAKVKINDFEKYLTKVKSN